MGTLSTAAQNAALDAVFDLVDGGAGAGYMEIQIAGNTEVATLTFSDPAFSAASSGTKTANAITSDSSATGNATAVSVCQFFDSNGVLVYTGTVGLSGADINLSTLSISAGNTVSVTSLTVGF